MTTRDLFILIVKLFGLYCLLQSIYGWSVFPNLSHLNESGDFTLILYGLAFVVIQVLIFWFLTFKAPWVVDRLRLGSGFSDTRIEFAGLTSTQIAMAGLFIIGGFQVVKQLPQVLRLLYWEVREAVRPTEHPDTDGQALVLAAVQLLVGWLLVTNYDWLARKIDHKSQEESPG